MTEKNRFDIEVGDTTPIEDDGIDFREIQTILAKKTEVLKKPSLLVFRPLKIRDEPKYENMHVKNLTVSDKIVKRMAGPDNKESKKDKDSNKKLDNILNFSLVVVSVVAVGVLIGTAVKYKANPKVKNPFDNTKIKPAVIMQEDSEARIINPLEQDYSNLSVILKTSTPNAITVTSTVSRELTSFGIDNQRVTTQEGLINAVEIIKNSNPNAEIIVIDVDGRSDTKENDVIVITNTEVSSVKSADNLAIAIRDKNNQQYGINTFIECGETKIGGGRVETAEQAALVKAGHFDVLSCNVKASAELISDEVVANSIATSIAEGIVRLGATEKEKRYANSIVISKEGDEIVPIAEANGMTHSAFIQSNMSIIEKGVITPNEAMVITKLPYTLNVKDTTVVNTLTTTNSNIDYYTEYYTVQSGQTVTQIADNIGVAIDDIYVPSGNKDKIKTGEKIGYTVPEKIVVREGETSKGKNN